LVILAGGGGCAVGLHQPPHQAGEQGPDGAAQEVQPALPVPCRDSLPFHLLEVSCSIFPQPLWLCPFLLVLGQQRDIVSGAHNQLSHVPLYGIDEPDAWGNPIGQQKYTPRDGTCGSWSLHLCHQQICVAVLINAELRWGSWLSGLTSFAFFHAVSIISQNSGMSTLNATFTFRGLELICHTSTTVCPALNSLVVSISTRSSLVRKMEGLLCRKEKSPIKPNVM